MLVFGGVWLLQGVAAFVAPPPLSSASSSVPRRARWSSIRGSSKDVELIIERGTYYADRARDEVVNKVRRAAFGDPLSQLIPGGVRGVTPGASVVVTGATSGIGFELCGVLTSLGYNVLLCGRDDAKLASAAEAAASRSRLGARVATTRLDLTSLSSTVSAAAEILRVVEEELPGPLEGLVLCAGVWPTILELTEDELELATQTNHVAHFALTRELLKKAALKRVLVVASSAHAALGEVEFDDVNWEERAFDSSENYSRSKLMNILYARELERRELDTNKDFRAVACHPGVVPTELFRDFGGSPSAWIPDPFGLVPQLPEDLVESAAAALGNVGRAALESPLVTSGLSPLKLQKEAARDLAFALLTPNAPTNAYYADGTLTPTTKLAQNDTKAKELWEWTEATLDAALANNDDDDDE